MYTQKLILGVVPVKRSFLSMEEAVRQKNKFMSVIRRVKPELVEIVDVDDIVEQGILYEADKVPAVVDKLKKAGIDALFLPFCDFGEEQAAAAVAAAFRVPVLVWGARDERPNTFEARGRDTQCGMFAATKVMRRYGVTYSYIFNCETESPRFASGYENFLRTAAVVKAVKGLRIAKIGDRPVPFMSVMANEADLLSRFGMVCVPISPSAVVGRMKTILEENSMVFQSYCENIRRRMDCAQTKEEDLRKAAAVKMAVQQLMEENNCSVGAFECWSAFPALADICPCLVLGEMADEGLPLACETDVNGAVTMAIRRACSLYEDVEFLADLTIRHPENDNAELLWHCGSFAKALKKEGAKGCVIREGKGFYELEGGPVTVLRFDGNHGEYYMFAGEAKGVDGPVTNGNYLWIETDNWVKWEKKFIFGPYIHHVVGIHGSYSGIIQEACRYLGIRIDLPDMPNQY